VAAFRFGWGHGVVSVDERRKRNNC
jgi:hypothetical protein